MRTLCLMVVGLIGVSIYMGLYQEPSFWIAMGFGALPGILRWAY